MRIDERRRIGETEAEVTVLGMGTAPLAGVFEAAAIALLDNVRRPTALGVVGAAEEGCTGCLRRARSCYILQRLPC